MKVKLSQDKMDYLCANLIRDNAQLRFKFEMAKIGDNCWIDLDDTIADEIRDWINQRLQEKGFDDNYELTKEGEILEDLSDAFYCK